MRLLKPKNRKGLNKHDSTLADKRHLFNSLATIMMIVIDFIPFMFVNPLIEVVFVINFHLYIAVNLLTAHKLGTFIVFIRSLIVLGLKIVMTNYIKQLKIQNCNEK
jgi:hypothetical protein